MEKENYKRITAAQKVSVVGSEFSKPNASIYTKSPHLLSTLTTNSISSRYGSSNISSVFEKEPLPASSWSSSSWSSPSDYPPNVTLVGNDDGVPSQIYYSNKFSWEADKLQEYPPHVGVMSPKDQFGHMKVNRYDFVLEEPYSGKERKEPNASCPLHGVSGRNTGFTGHEKPEEHEETRGARRMGTDMCSSEGKKEWPPLGSIDNYVQLEDRPDKVSSLAENQGPQRPIDLLMNPHYTKLPLLMTPNYKGMLPSINSFTSSIQYAGIPNPFLSPMLYPGNFESSVFSPVFGIQSQFCPFGSDPYYWMHERNRDLAASIYPSVIRPKQMINAPPFVNLTRPQSENQPSMLNHLPYPDPAAMFRAANLCPPFFTKRENTQNVVNNGTPILSNETVDQNISNTISTWNAEKCTNQGNNTPYYSHQTIVSSQVPWVRPEMSVSYTVAADPSEVMTYLPKTSLRNWNDVEAGDTSDNQEAYVKVDCEDGDQYTSCQEPFNQTNGSTETKKPRVPPSRKAHICNICGKTYARAFTLKTHQRVHTGEKPYKCKVCQRKFAQGNGLESHIRIHTGEKPYKCQVCQRAFSHSSAVKSHLRTHTGEKPFRCNSCGKHFGDQSTLKKHNRVHTGEKPFKCYICHFTFTQIGNMNKHLKNIHGDKSK